MGFDSGLGWYRAAIFVTKHSAERSAVNISFTIPGFYFTLIKVDLVYETPFWTMTARVFTNTAQEHEPWTDFRLEFGEASRIVNGIWRHTATAIHA